MLITYTSPTLKCVEQHHFFCKCKIHKFVYELINQLELDYKKIVSKCRTRRFIVDKIHKQISKERNTETYAKEEIGSKFI